MSDLNQQLVGRKYRELFPLAKGDVVVGPGDFGERVVVLNDIAIAFPQSITGLINTAAGTYGLASDAIFAEMMDTS